MFKFPKPPDRKVKWERAIHRKNFKVTNFSVVCIRRFDEKYIIRSDSLARLDGSVLTVPRTKSKLTDDAYPTIFEHQPAYMNNPIAAERKNPEVGY